jgi:GNAT superfamily N-acetyltransferase
MFGKFDSIPTSFLFFITSILSEWRSFSSSYFYHSTLLGGQYLLDKFFLLILYSICSLNSSNDRIHSSTNSNLMLKIRPAEEKDIDAIFELIRGLAAYEKLTDCVTGNTELLRSHLFSERSYAEVIVAELEVQTIGFALFFHTYSTFLTQPGLYLEDVFVRPEYRRQGVGKALMTSVVQIAARLWAARMVCAGLESKRDRVLSESRCHCSTRLENLSDVRRNAS